MVSLFLGAYVPLTEEGNIIVDDVLTSCYADFHHSLAHLVMKPMKMISETMEWVFGNDMGFPVYVRVGQINASRIKII